MKREQQNTTVILLDDDGTERPATVLDDVIAHTRAGVVQRAAKHLMIEPTKLLRMLRQVWSVSKGQPPLTDEELFVGVSLIARYELDPITREVYVTRGKDGRLMTIVGIDGFVKILNRTEGYDGFTQTTGFSEDGSVYSVQTTIWHKNRSHPTMYTAYASEYARIGGFVAKQMPIHMLSLFSLRHAIRLFTPLGACVITEQEAAAFSQSEPEPAKPARKISKKDRFAYLGDLPQVPVVLENAAIVDVYDEATEPEMTKHE